MVCETEKPKSSGNSAISFLINVDLPTPLGPVITQAPPLKEGGRLTVAIGSVSEATILPWGQWLGVEESRS